MFNDVLTSERGPGVIGFLLAILVLGGFGGMALIVLEQDSFQAASPEEELVARKEVFTDLNEKIELKQAELNMYRALREKAAELPRLEAVVAQNEVALVNAGNENKQLQDASEAVYADWEGYRAEYRKNERALWMGRTVDLSEIKGPDFKECTVTSITPLLLRIRTPKGVLRGIEFKDLPLKIRDQLQFADDEADEYKRQLIRINAANQELAEIRNQAEMEEQAERAAEGRIQQIAKIKRLIIQRTSKRESRMAEARALKQKIASLKSKSGRGGNGRRIIIIPASIADLEAKLRGLEKAVRDLENNIQQLNNELAELKSQR